MNDHPCSVNLFNASYATRFGGSIAIHRDAMSTSYSIKAEATTLQGASLILGLDEEISEHPRNVSRPTQRIRVPPTVSNCFLQAM